MIKLALGMFYFVIVFAFSKKEIEMSMINIKNNKHPLASLQNDFERTMNTFQNLFDAPQFSEKALEELSIKPSIDVVDDKDHFKIEAELPGVGEEDIKVSISDGLLTIRGEKNVSKQDKGKNYLMREIGYGSYERTITLPDSVDLDKATASFKKGMLWVNIPKKAETVKRSRDLKIEKVT